GDRPAACVVQGVRDRDAEPESRKGPAAAQRHDGAGRHRRNRRAAEGRLGIHQGGGALGSQKSEGGAMNRFLIAAALFLGVSFGYSGRAWTQTDQKLPMPGYDVAKDFANAKELPDPNVDYKVVFSVAANAKADEIHPTLKTIALYLNTLAHNGVPANHRHVAAPFQKGGGDAVLLNDVYQSQPNGVDTPNIGMLRELKQGGVDMRVCGQGLLGKNVEPSQVLPGVQVDLWAMTTMVNLQLRGYVRIGG